MKLFSDPPAADAPHVEAAESRSRRRLRDRLNVRVVIAVLSLAIIGNNTLVIYRMVQQEHEKAVAATIRDNSNLVLAFEQYITRTITIADAVTQVVAREVSHRGQRLDLAWIAHEQAFESNVVAVASVIDANGQLVASSDSTAGNDRARAGAQAELAYHAREDTRGVHVGLPENVTDSGLAMIPISRRLNQPDGSFAGIVLVQVESARFTDFYDTIARRPDDVMSLIGLDGVSRARKTGHADAPVRDLKHVAIGAEQLAQPSGNFISTSSVDGVRRFISFRALKDFPLLAVVGVSETDALADVRRRTRRYYAGATVSAALVSTFALLLIGALRRRDKALAALSSSEAALRAREEEFRTLAESMPQLVWTTAADGHHTYFNQQWSDYTGLSPEQSAGDGWKAAFDPTERARVVERWHEAIASGEVYEAEYRLRGRDGTYRWMLARALPLRDSTGRITKWFGTSTDINDKVVAQEQLREAQHVAHIGSWTHESATGVNTWSEELYHICGLSPAHFTPADDSIANLIHPDDRPQFLRETALWRSNMKSFESDLRIVRPDGEVRFVHHSVAIDSSRNDVGVRVHGTVQDVTEARAAEQKLREQANLLNLSHDAIVVREADDTIRFWNHGAERVYGWSAEEVLGRRASDFCYVDRAKFFRAKEVLAERGEWAGELEHFCKDGSIVSMGNRWSAAPDEQTGKTSVLVINTDLTEQKKLEQQQLRTQRLESIGTLASGVAHDLNNILAPIMMAAPLLRDELPAERRCQLVGILEHNAERGAAIVRQVLTFAHGADGERVLVQPIYALKEIAQIARDTFPKSVTTRTEFSEDLALIEADPTELHHVLLNLCVNARDAMPDGGTLSLSAENFQVDEQYAAMTPGLTCGPHLLIKVTDTGTGIPPEIMDKIFDPFFTTKGVGSGTGLGLSTVLGVVRNYGGSVEAESVGRGTTFRILLPAAGADIGPVATSSEEELPGGRGETILVVDDEDAIRAVAEPLLRKHGYEVLLAADAPAALTLFAEHSAQIALTLTDLSMPMMSGIALARTLRKMQPEASIIISAGREDICNAAEMDEIGVAATLPKPYTQAALLRLLDQVISPNRKTI